MVECNGIIYWASCGRVQRYYILGFLWYRAHRLLPPEDTLVKCIFNVNLYIFSFKTLLSFQKCKICRKKGSGDDVLLLCGECNLGYHLYCLRPALNNIPKGEWKCMNCQVRMWFILGMFRKTFLLCFYLSHFNSQQPVSSEQDEASNEFEVRV